MLRCLQQERRIRGSLNVGQFLPDSFSPLAVVLLQINVLRVDGYFSDHMDDWTRPWGTRGNTK